MGDEAARHDPRNARCGLRAGLVHFGGAHFLRFEVVKK
jgi:hypothetical protein